MAIFLIRHGETPLNASRVLQWPDTPLSERGQQPDTGDQDAHQAADRSQSIDVEQLLPRNQKDQQQDEPICQRLHRCPSSSNRS